MNRLCTNQKCNRMTLLLQIEKCNSALSDVQHKSRSVTFDSISHLWIFHLKRWVGGSLQISICFENSFPPFLTRVFYRNSICHLTSEELSLLRTWSVASLASTFVNLSAASLLVLSQRWFACCIGFMALRARRNATHSHRRVLLAQLMHFAHMKFLCNCFIWQLDELHEYMYDSGYSQTTMRDAACNLYFDADSACGQSLLMDGFNFGENQMSNPNARVSLRVKKSEACFPIISKQRRLAWRCFAFLFLLPPCFISGWLT